METPQNPDELDTGTVDAEPQSHLNGSPNPTTSAEAAPRVLSLNEYLAIPGFPDEVKDFFVKHLNICKSNLDGFKKEDKQDVVDFITEQIRLLESDPLRYLLKELDYANNNLSNFLNLANSTDKTDQEKLEVQNLINYWNDEVNKYTRYIKELEEIVQRSPVPDSSPLTPSETQTAQMPQNEQTPEPSGSVATPEIKSDSVIETKTENESLELLEQEIESAKNFDELYEILRNSGGFDVQGHFYKTEELIQKIETFRIYPNRTALADITKEKGLRSKVEQLQNQYLNEQNFAEPEKESNIEYKELNTRDILKGEIYSVQTDNATYLLKRSDDGFLYIKGGAVGSDFEKIGKTGDGLDAIGIGPSKSGILQVDKVFYVSISNRTLGLKPIHKIEKIELKEEKNNEESEEEKTPEAIILPNTPATPLSPGEVAPAGTPKSITTPPTPEAIPDVETALAQARENYANVLIEYKNKHREHKAWYQKILSDLGFEKSLHDMPVPKGLEDLKATLETAENNYISAKKEKAREIINTQATEEDIKKIYPDFVAGQGVSEEMASALYKVKLIEQAEKEWNTLQKKILENTPPKEAGKIRKAFAAWQRVPLKVRMSLSVVVLPVLVGTAAVFAMPATAAGGLAVGASVAGLRSARAIGGIVGSGLAGKGFDMLEKKRSKSFHNSLLDQYNVDEDNFEEKERNLMRGFEENQIYHKRDKVAKTVAMVAGGLSAGLLAGGAESHIESFAKTHLGGVANGVDGVRPKIVLETPADNVQPKHFWDKWFNVDKKEAARLAKVSSPDDADITYQNPGVKIDAPNIPKPRPLTDMKVEPSNYDMGKSSGAVSPDASHTTPPQVEPVKVPQAPIVPKAETVASVELSEHGYIQTFINLKAELSAKYPDLNSVDVPPGVKHFLSTPSTKLAQEYGFWDAKAGTSAMGFKGEHLIVDSGGNLKLEHLGGRPSELVDAAAHKFDTMHQGQMKVFGPETPSHKIAIHDTGAKTVPPNEGDELNSLMENQTRSTLYGEYRPVAPIPDYAPDNIGVGHSGVGHELLDEYGEPVARVHYGPSTPSHLENFENSYTPRHIYSDTMYHSVVTGKDINVKIIDAGGGHDGIVIDGQPVAVSVPMPRNGSRMVLEDIYQDGKNYRAIREAFTTAYNDYLRLHLPKTGDTIGHTFQFENGQIDIARGLSENPNQIDVLLNGKKFASGVMTAHGPKLTIDHTLSRHSWWQPHTVYDRAFENLKHNLGLKKFKDVVADFTVAKK